MTKLCDGPHAVPLEIAGGRHFVTVSLQGPDAKADVRFHVDTGGNTPGLMLDKAVADKLGIAAADSQPRTLVINGRELPVPAGASWIIHDDEQGRRYRKTFSGGQIGAGFLSRYIVCLDPAGRKLALGDPATLAVRDVESPGVSVARLMMQEGGKNKALYPFVHVLLEAGGEFTGGYGMLLDTGAPASMLDANKVEYQHSQNPGWAFMEGAAGDSDMIGAAMPETLILAESVKINTPGALANQLGITQPPPIAVGKALFVSRPTGTWDKMFGSVKVTMGSHGALGNDVLNRFRLLIDYPGRRLYMTPAQQAAPSSSMLRVGISVQFGADGCAEIRAVTSTNTDETKRALAVGDILLKIDGKDACKMMHHEIAKAVEGMPGDAKKLVVRRAGKDTEIVTKVANLLAQKP